MIAIPRIDAGSLSAYAQDLLDRAAKLDRAALHPRRFKVHDLDIEAWFSDAAYADLCERNLAQSPAVAVAQHVTLYLLDSESLSWAPPAAWGGAILDRQIVNRALAAASLRGAYIHEPHLWQFFSPGAHAGVQLTGRAGATSPWESGGPLRSFLHWAFADRGLHLCHAATLGIAGRGVMLAGAGGSGKSGTTLAGIAGGLKTAGDDYCLVEMAGQVRAYSIFRLVKQDRPGLARVMGAASALASGPLNWQDKLEIHASAFAADPFVQELEIQAILVPNIARSPATTFKPVSPAAAMRAFAPTSAFQLPDNAAAEIQFASAVCRSLPCFAMALSEDAGEIAAALHRFIERGQP